MARVGPLWKQIVPKYPLYAPGAPQNRVFLCPFWMMLVKPRKEIPSDTVHFVVHPQMSKLDVKQYLEKIYNVNVLTVKTRIEQGAIRYYQPSRRFNREGFVPAGFRRDGRKFAVVVLGGDEKFTFPDIFDNEDNPGLKESKKEQENAKASHELSIKKLPYKDIPEWFAG